MAATSLPVDRYLVASGTWQFLGNAVFFPVGYGLPGVFGDHANPAVNGSLWTLKFEVACYAVSLLYARLGRGRLPLLIAGWLTSLVLSHSLTDGETGAMFYIERFAFLFRFYGAGMLLYAWRDRLPLRTDLALAAFVLVCLSPLLRAFAEAAATLGAYALVVVAYRAPVWFRAITRKGDISYGVYLYAFPIQQLVVPLSMKTAVPWLTNIALALPLTLFAGTLSWLILERRFLRRKIDQTPAAHAF
jgi:peptidoglycan/LPS O-acetylase OafA/YrhL